VMPLRNLPANLKFNIEPDRDLKIQAEFRVAIPCWLHSALGAPWSLI
jgi:hypothetical protein